MVLRCRTRISTVFTHLSKFSIYIKLICNLDSINVTVILLPDSLILMHNNDSKAIGLLMGPSRRCGVVGYN